MRATLKSEIRPKGILCAALARTFGAPVHLSDDIIRNSTRHQSDIFLFRVLHDGGVSRLPRLLFAKFHHQWMPSADDQSEEAWLRRFNPDQLNCRTAWQRYTREITGLQLMANIRNKSLRSPRLIAHSDEDLMIVMEGFHEAPTLIDFLNGSDEAAARKALGRVLRAYGEVQTCSERSSSADDAQARFDNELFISSITRLISFSRQHAIVISAGLERDLERVLATISSAPRVFTTGDVGPGNQFVLEREIVLFDLEHSGFRSSAIEIGALAYPFPATSTTSAAAEWWISDLALQITDCRDSVLAQMSVGEREALMASGLTWWVLSFLGSDLHRALVSDYRWGRSTVRARHLYGLERVATSSFSRRAFPEVVAWFWELLTLFRSMWVDAEDMPEFPAFHRHQLDRHIKVKA